MKTFESVIVAQVVGTGRTARRRGSECAGAATIDAMRSAIVTRLIMNHRSAARCRLLYSRSATLDGVSPYRVGGQGRPRHPPSLLHRIVGRDADRRTALSPFVDGIAAIHGVVSPREAARRRAGRHSAFG